MAFGRAWNGRGAPELARRCGLPIRDTAECHSALRRLTLPATSDRKSCPPCVQAQRGVFRPCGTICQAPSSSGLSVAGRASLLYVTENIEKPAILLQNSASKRLKPASDLFGGAPHDSRGPQIERRDAPRDQRARENWTAGELPVAVGAGKFTAGAHLPSHGERPATRKADLRSHRVEPFCRRLHPPTEGAMASTAGMQMATGLSDQVRMIIGIAGGDLFNASRAGASPRRGASGG